MAKQCSICGKPFGKFERPDGIFGVFDMCSSCLSEVKRISQMANSKDIKSYSEAKSAFYNRYKDSPSIEKLLIKMDEVYEIKGNGFSTELQSEARRKEEESLKNARDIVENASNMLVTTGTLFDGYVVEKYIDVIYEEIIFKNSLKNSLVASIEDLGNALSFSEREMTGASRLIARARSILMEKFRLQAAEMGANAILGIDFETSFGSDVVCATVNGTAVVIRKKEDT